MNIFFLDSDPIIAARYNCNTHCNKMLEEICQMLANCFSEHQLKNAPPTKSGEPRVHSYYNHPISRWVRNSKQNYEWSLIHAKELEIQRLRIPYNPHFSYPFLLWAEKNINLIEWKNTALEEFPIAIKEDKKCRMIPGFLELSRIEQYREYYCYDKHFAEWRNREIPFWFQRKFVYSINLNEIIL